MQRTTRILPLLGTLAFALQVSSQAQVEGSLVHAVPPPDSTSPSTGSSFGNAVALSGSLLAVGAPSDNTGANDTGHAYVFDLAGPTPTIPAFDLPNPSPFPDAHLGTSVSIDGSLVAVGVPGETVGGFTNAGRVQIFDLDSPTPATPVHTIDNPGPANNEYFGFSVSLSGNLLAIGTPGDTYFARAACGLCHVYELSGPSPTLRGSIVQQQFNTDDGFGNAVSLSGTLLAVGSPFDDPGGSNVGSVWVYDVSGPIPPLSLSGTPFLGRDLNPNSAAFTSFGAAVALSGTQLVVSAPYTSSALGIHGVTYYYDLSPPIPSNLDPDLTFPNPTPSTDDNFGISLAIDGSRLVIGADGEDGGATSSGVAHVFNLTSETPTVPVAILKHPNPAGFIDFGTAVAVSGDTTAVGSPSDSSYRSLDGSVHVFDPGPPVLTVEFPPGTTLASGVDSIPLLAAIGHSSPPLQLTLRNSGDAVLTSFASLLDGTHPTEFSAEAPLLLSLPAGQSITLALTFSPPGPTGSPRSATLHLGSNDPSSPFDLDLAGTALDFVTDTDGDTLNDASELLMGALGFDWQSPQPTLVATLLDNATGAGLYNLSEVQALNVNTPILQRDPGTGVFSLILGLQKSTDGQQFDPFPMTAPATSITPLGELKFDFTPTDGAALFRLETGTP